MDYVDLSYLHMLGLYTPLYIYGWNEKLKAGKRRYNGISNCYDAAAKAMH